MMASSLPPPFFNTYSLSMLSLRCKALYIISYLFLWSISWTYSLVHFKSGPEYLTMGTTQAFMPLMRFLLFSLVSSSFLVLLRYSFFLIHLFPFLLAFWFFLDLAVLFLPSFVFFRFSLWEWYIFLCQIPFLYLDCIFLLFVSESPILFHFFFDVVHIY